MSRRMVCIEQADESTKSIDVEKCSRDPVQKVTCVFELNVVRLPIWSSKLNCTTIAT